MLFMLIEIVLIIFTVFIEVKITPIRTRAEEEIERQLDAEMMRGLERQKQLKEEQEKSKLTRQRNKTSLIQVGVVSLVFGVFFLRNIMEGTLA